MCHHNLFIVQGWFNYLRKAKAKKKQSYLFACNLFDGHPLTFVDTDGGENLGGW